ncbi:hypothetical protein OPT61_g8216 [Boeremia exigua]|uniref:Uncharacterized protein n=1 Tax=Boeremia exigua TaxID=749465 RepID=A0ACC2I0T5_9PLEO|nr:hypothetical protein OPT61_g8216 [Boeremia exigua]
MPSAAASRQVINSRLLLPNLEFTNVQPGYKASHVAMPTGCLPNGLRTPVVRATGVDPVLIQRIGLAGMLYERRPCNRTLAPQRLHELDHDGWAGVTLVTNRPSPMAITRGIAAPCRSIPPDLSVTCSPTPVPGSTIAVRDYITRFRPPENHRMHILGSTTTNFQSYRPVMKYGDTLRQRSIPEWGHFNIDYDYLKDLIKHQTTSGTNKAVSIPGQGTGSTEKAFGETFLRVLQAQHDRINLFVRSKSGEIERRLDHISRSLEQLHNKVSSLAPLPARTVEKYAKIDADVAKTAEEIRSLSRFVVVQRTGFAKILKKYKRWTSDRELQHAFRDEVSGRPDSLFQLDLGYLLDQYIDVLGALRSVFDGHNATTAHTKNIDVQLPAARISKALEHDDQLDFDLALSTVPLGANGHKATFWVHPDHVVEVQVLLLQHMRLHTKSTKATSRRPSANATPRRRQSSSAGTDRNFGNEDHVGLQVLDYAEAFALKQNASTIGSSEEARGNVGIKAAAHVRFSAAAEAAIVVCTATDPRTQSPGGLKIAKLKRRFTDAFLDTSKPLPDKQNVRFVDRTGSFYDGEEEAQSIRQWLSEHKEIKPIAGVGAKRTRFAGLHNNSSGGIWATLDREVFMKESLVKDLANDDWAQTAILGSAVFPHAILEVRREGTHSASLIQTLDRSHLVERVRGFSIEAHAVWVCCKPSSMSAPHWISLLDQDIRKLPEPVRRRSRKNRESASGSNTQSPPPMTSASNTSLDGQLSPSTLRNGESSATSAPEFVDPPSLQAFRKKHRKSYADETATVGEEPEPQRYWNEYDHPEDAEEGYYIYVDPNATVKFPGQETIEAWTKKTRQLFGMRLQAEERSLLSAVDEGTTDDEDSGSESQLGWNPQTDYGTISSQSGRAHEGYFSSLFRASADPRLDAEAFHERRTLLGELEARDRERERTKLRFYSTCLAAAFAIDFILGLMTMTSRKKERGAVDAGVLFGAADVELDPPGRCLEHRAGPARPGLSAAIVGSEDLKMPSMHLVMERKRRITLFLGGREETLLLHLVFQRNLALRSDRFARYPCIWAWFGLVRARDDEVSSRHLTEEGVYIDDNGARHNE